MNADIQDFSFRVDDLVDAAGNQTGGRQLTIFVKAPVIDGANQPVVLATGALKTITQTLRIQFAPESAIMVTQDLMADDAERAALGEERRKPTVDVFNALPPNGHGHPH